MFYLYSEPVDICFLFSCLHPQLFSIHFIEEICTSLSFRCAIFMQIPPAFSVWYSFIPGYKSPVFLPEMRCMYILCILLVHTSVNTFYRQYHPSTSQYRFLFPPNVYSFLAIHTLQSTHLFLYTLCVCWNVLICPANVRIFKVRCVFFLQKVLGGIEYCSYLWLSGLSWCVPSLFLSHLCHGIGMWCSQAKKGLDGPQPWVMINWTNKRYQGTWKREATSYVWRSCECDWRRWIASAWDRNSITTKRERTLEEGREGGKNVSSTRV